MTRRELREEIFKLLFMVEFYSKEEMAEQVKSYFEDFPEKEISEKDHAYIEEKYENICAVLPEIDEKIAGAAKGWKLERIGKSDLSILRLGVYEMLYDDDIPVGVAINEAVELAKSFGENESCLLYTSLSSPERRWSRWSLRKWITGRSWWRSWTGAKKM